jgi:glycosyltransferase involved in cell wall biosynthesis
MSPLISVIVPVYNVEQYVRECLDSILAQSYRSLEVILVDDGSTDGSGTICDEYAAADSRVKVFHQKNSGVSTARNNGLLIAKGEWVMFVDADDWLETECFETLYPYTQRGVDVAVFGICLEHDTFSSKIFAESKTIANNKLILILLEYASHKKYTSLLNAPVAKLLRRSFLDENNITFMQHISYGEDTVFVLDIIDCSGRIEFNDKCFYHYRTRADSACNKYNPSSTERIMKLYSLVSTRYEIIHKKEFASVLNAYLVQLFLHDCIPVYYFHPDNPKRFSETKVELLEFLDKEPLKTASSETRLRDLDIKPRIKLILVRLRLLRMLRLINTLVYQRKVGSNKNRL